MEKCNVYILLRQSLNKSNWHPFITHELFFHRFSFLSLFLLLQVIIKNLKVRREHELTCAREEYLQPTDKRKNRKNFITTKRVRRKERIWIFQKKELEKNKQECAHQRNVPNKIMVPRMPANPSGKLKKYNSLDTHSF